MKKISGKVSQPENGHFPDLGFLGCKMVTLGVCFFLKKQKVEEILARSNFGEFGELPKIFAKFAKISSRKI